MAKQPRKPRHTPTARSSSEPPTDTNTPAIAQQTPIDTATDTPSPTGEYIATRTGNQTPPERKATIYNLADIAKMSAREIAQRLSMDPRTVNAILATREHLKVDVRNHLDSLALDAVKHWGTAMEEGARKGKHAPARDLLLHTKIIEPVQTEGHTTQIAIVVGAPGQPISLTPPQVLEPQDDSD